MNKFTEEMATVDAVMRKQDDRLNELTSKLAERVAALDKVEKSVFDDLQAIIAREGGGQVSFRDGGRTCTVEPLEDGSIKATYRSDFTSDPLHEAFLHSSNTEETEAIENFDALRRAHIHYENRAAGIALAQKLIETYVSWQRAIANDRSRLIDAIVGKDDEESYW